MGHAGNSSTLHPCTPNLVQRDGCPLFMHVLFDSNPVLEGVCGVIIVFLTGATSMRPVRGVICGLYVRDQFCCQDSRSPTKFRKHYVSSRVDSTKRL